MSGKVVWLGSPAPVFPYAEPPQALIDEALGAPGLFGAAPSSGTLAAAPHVAWTRALADAFVAAATRLPARLSVTRNAMTEHTAPLDGAPLTADGKARAYDLFALDAGHGSASLDELRATADEVRLELPCDVETFRTAGYGPPPHVVELPRTAAWVAHVTRWPHLLWLLQGAPFALRAASLGLELAKGAMNRVGNGVKVHRTAYVEASVLEDGVEVDAHATVVGSCLGRGVRVADHTAIHHSVIGPECSTLADSLLRRVVALPSSTLSSFELCEVILGRGAFITAGVIFFRGEPMRTVRVGQSPDDEEDSGRSELGGAVGHRCVLGARAMFVPGRAIPSGTVIVMRPEEGVTRMPQVAPGTPVAWDRGALVDVAQRWPGHPIPEIDPAAH